jgi:hypothetical protein
MREEKLRKGTSFLQPGFKKKIKNESVGTCQLHTQQFITIFVPFNFVRKFIIKREDNINMDLREKYGKVRIGCVWFRIETSSVLSCTR